MAGEVSKRKGLLVAFILLCTVCLGQFAYIFWDIARAGSKKPSPPYITDPSGLLKWLEPPKGMKFFGSTDGDRGVTAYGKGNFDACFWLDLSDEAFSGKRTGYIETLISGTARGLARQIADRVPGGHVARHFPGSEAFNLSGTYVVAYPGGWVVVTAVYMNPRRDVAGGHREKPADAEFEMIKVRVHGFGERGSR